jgi:hypothetical protein
MMNWKRCGRKRSTPNLSYSPAILPKGLRKATKTYEDKTGFPVYKVGQRPLRPRKAKGLCATLALHLRGQ